MSVYAVSASVKAAKTTSLEPKKRLGVVDGFQNVVATRFIVVDVCSWPWLVSRSSNVKYERRRQIHRLWDLKKPFQVAKRDVNVLLAVLSSHLAFALLDGAFVVDCEKTVTILTCKDIENAYDLRFPGFWQRVDAVDFRLELDAL